MAGALLLSPRPRWRIGMAFGAAVLIHCGAVGLASIQSDKQIDEVGIADPSLGPVIIIDPGEPSEEPTPPPEVDASPPPTVSSEDLIPEEHTSPPPVQRRPSKPVTSTPKNQNDPMNLSTVKVLALHAPRPEYPYEARRQRTTGDGVVVLTINPMSGAVIDVTMLKSTGSALLDNATITAFRRWRFKAGTISKVKAPITFSLTGPQY